MLYKKEEEKRSREMALVGSFFEFKNQKKEYNGAGEPKRNKRHNI